MDEKITDLYNKKETKCITLDVVNGRILDLKDVIVTCSKYIELEHVIDSVNKILEREENNLIRLKNEENEIEHEIEEYQKTCSHEFVYRGHDSHYDFYICKKCGKEERN